VADLSLYNASLLDPLSLFEWLSHWRTFYRTRTGSDGRTRRIQANMVSLNSLIMYQLSKGLFRCPLTKLCRAASFVTSLLPVSAHLVTDHGQHRRPGRPDGKDSLTDNCGSPPFPSFGSRQRCSAQILLSRHQATRHYLLLHPPAQPASLPSCFPQLLFRTSSFRLEVLCLYLSASSVNSSDLSLTRRRLLPCWYRFSTQTHTDISPQLLSLDSLRLSTTLQRPSGSLQGWFYILTVDLADLN
jgi:hypothetical protein